MRGIRTGNIGIIDRQKHTYSHTHAILQLFFRVLVLVFRNCKTSAAFNAIHSKQMNRYSNESRDLVLAKMIMLRMVMTKMMTMMMTKMMRMMMIMIFQDRAQLGCES